MRAVVFGAVFAALLIFLMIGSIGANAQAPLAFKASGTPAPYDWSGFMPAAIWATHGATRIGPRTPPGLL